jgi:hypothetical protein
MKCISVAKLPKHINLIYIGNRSSYIPKHTLPKNCETQFPDYIRPKKIEIKNYTAPNIENYIQIKDGDEYENCFMISCVDHLYYDGENFMYGIAAILNNLKKNGSAIIKITPHDAMPDMIMLCGHVFNLCKIQDGYLYLNKFQGLKVKLQEALDTYFRYLFDCHAQICFFVYSLEYDKLKRAILHAFSN